jgi:hypothetical protein
MVYIDFPHLHHLNEGVEAISEVGTSIGQILLLQ